MSWIQELLLVVADGLVYSVVLTTYVKLKAFAKRLTSVFTFISSCFSCFLIRLVTDPELTQHVDLQI